MNQPLAPAGISGPDALTDRATTAAAGEIRAISVIVCSVDASKSDRISAHYRALLAGYPHELVVIGEARSLAEGYNRGLARSAGDIVVFSHDDIEIVSDDFAGRLLRHLAVHDVVGVAGTSHLVGPSWAAAGQPHLHGCIVHRRGPALNFACYGPPTARAQAIDGAFFAARRAVCEAVPFDAATFDGRHHYDLDFSYRAFLAGFDIVIPWDILIVDDSGGRYDARWQLYADRFMAKHRARLPPGAPHQPSWSTAQFGGVDEVLRLQRQMLAGPTLSPDIGGADHQAASVALKPEWLSALSELPLCLPQSAWLGHIPFLFLLIRLMRPALFVELGVDLGASYLAACEASRRDRTGTRCVGVDTWLGDEHAGLRDGTRVFQAMSRFVGGNYPGAALLRSTFDAAVTEFEDGTIDLLHIDGLHTYEAVKHDFETWRPKLSKRAVVLLHDTRVWGHGFGVWRFLAELRERYWTFEFAHASGLAMVAVGSAADDDLKEFTRFVAQSPMQAQAVRTACENAATAMANRVAERDRNLGPTAPVNAAGLILSWESPAPAKPVSRNDPCPCGSGKRYKHCHGKLA